MAMSSMIGSYMTAGSMGMTQNKATGIDGRYISIKEIKEPNFQRDLTKNEGNIIPDRGSTIKIAPKKIKKFE